MEDKSLVTNVRESKVTDTNNIYQYWKSASDEHLIGMGVDIEKRE